MALNLLNTAKLELNTCLPIEKLHDLLDLTQNLFNSPYLTEWACLDSAPIGAFNQEWLTVCGRHQAKREAGTSLLLIPQLSIFNRAS